MFTSHQIALYYYYKFIAKKPYKSLLDHEERRERGRRIPRSTLLRYGESPFHHFYNCGVNQALLNMTGLDYQAFAKLLHLFSHKYDTYTLDITTGLIREKLAHKHRTRGLDAIGGLGLVLIWYRTRVPSLEVWL